MIFQPLVPDKWLGKSDLPWLVLKNMLYPVFRQSWGTRKGLCETEISFGLNSLSTFTLHRVLENAYIYMCIKCYKILRAKRANFFQSWELHRKKSEGAGLALPTPGYNTNVLFKVGMTTRNNCSHKLLTNICSRSIRHCYVNSRLYFCDQHR